MHRSAVADGGELLYDVGPGLNRGERVQQTSLFVTGAVTAAPSAAQTTGQYRIIATGFRVLHETKDDILSRDGHGDEVYRGFAMFHFDRSATASNRRTSAFLS